MKNLVVRFNKNPNIEDFKNILNLHFCNHNVCINCLEPIYYNDTRLKYSIDKGLSIIGKSEYSTKQIDNNTYNLCRCEKCVIEKYPEYLTKNKSRMFNTLQPITIYAFNISDKDVETFKSDNKHTLKNYIKKYGEELGNSKWEIYCNKQAYSNSLEYKSDKYGWSLKEFNDYNNSRSITYEKCIERHGYEKGLDVWNNYREKQKVNGCKLEYFQSLYGDETGLNVWTDLCKKKSNNITTFITKYGNIEGENRYKEYLDKISKNIKPYSKISQKLFLRLDEYLKPYNLTTYFYTKNKEYGKNLGYKYVYLDYFIKELNLCIEFNGTIFHADPLLYSASDNPLYFDKTVVASDLWVKDANRIKALKDLYNIDTLVIWESEISNKGIETICKELTLKISQNIQDNDICITNTNT